MDNDHLKEIARLQEENSELKNKLKKLEESLQKNNHIFNHIQGLYFETNLDGEIIDLTPANKEITQYSKEELLGKNVNIIYKNPEHRRIFLNELNEKGKVENFNLDIKDKDGEIKRAAINACLIKSEKGDPDKIVGIIRDTTEIEKINKDLRWLRRAIEQSPMSIIITDIEGKIEYTNPFFTKVTGYSREEIIGKNPSILKSGKQPPIFYKKLWDTITKGNTWEGEFHNKRKDGTLFWEKASISPVRNSKGEIVNYIAIKEDFTKQKAYAEEIARLKAFNEQIVNTMMEGILVEDKNGTILYTNPAFTNMTGYCQNELIGNNWDMVVSGESRNKVVDANKRRRNNISDSYEVKIKTKKGKTLPVLVGGSPIIENNEYKGLVAVFTNIKNLKDNEKKIKKALKQAKLSDKLKSSFLANMSHEIRTPMNAILGFAEILRSERDIEENTREEYFDIIEEKGNELLQIISDIIDISKIESRIIDINNHEFELNEFLKSIYASFKTEIEHSERLVQVKLTLPNIPDDLFITTDRYRLNQVITNLLNNANKFTKNGIIELGYSTNCSYVDFFVRDTGIGISEQDQKIIFERFRQAENNYTREFGGTGLGLNICKNLVNLLGGKMRVESRLNEGSTFYFTIPITKK